MQPDSERSFIFAEFQLNRESELYLFSGAAARASIEPRRSPCQTETEHRGSESRSELPLFYSPSRLGVRLFYPPSTASRSSLGLCSCIHSPSTAAPSRSFRLRLQYYIHRAPLNLLHQLANEPLDEPAGPAGRSLIQPEQAIWPTQPRSAAALRVRASEVAPLSATNLADPAEVRAPSPSSLFFRA